MIDDALPDRHEWSRIYDASWDDPLDPSFARLLGGRWNPPGSWPTLYLDEDVVTARLNLTRFIADWPYEPEDLADDTGPHLAIATLPRSQRVADLHSAKGVAAVGLPASYPLDRTGELVGPGVCQAIGEQVHTAGLRGVRCRSAQAPLGAGREVAWFPATSRSRAHLVTRRPFTDWFWG
ncbi:MAG: RES family NAD+ phosphorylase [Nitriliruptor sp.]|uniref:RES family NAD+ phosphorylase n=1 Tax=Nitriliruptor sp. TaxID=2448056 RepID=UPI0034A070D4